MSEKLDMIERDFPSLSIKRQCALIGIPRSSYYYEAIPETELNLRLMRKIDELYLDNPSLGRRTLTANLKRQGEVVNHKRVSRLMRNMGIEAIYAKQKVRTSVPGNIKFPYLLKNLIINTPNQVWGTDITYIPVDKGYIYLVVFLDLYSRYVLSWRLSNSLESTFCLEALEMAFKVNVPQIVNSDQGVQFTSHAYLDLVKSKDVRVSMSGKGRCWDNIFVERFWRTAKYEEVYLHQYEDATEAHKSIENYIQKYNTKRLHSALGYRTPEEVYTQIA